MKKNKRKKLVLVKTKVEEILCESGQKTIIELKMKRKKREKIK